ncbi:MAG: hypothetical protein RQ728_08865 [Brevefilum sp.]|nr:hypothetical protein [Brevefilum sp.]
MTQKYLFNQCFGRVRTWLFFWLITAVILSLFPLGIADASLTFDTPEVQSLPTPRRDPQMFDSFLPPGRKDKPAAAKSNPAYPYSPPGAPYPNKSNTSQTFTQHRSLTSVVPEQINGTGSDRNLTDSSSLPGNLPYSIDPRSLLGGITIDLTYDVVMGFVNPGDTVMVTVGSEGYGAAVADGVGFFWTPVWHNTNGYQLGIDCEMTISITVESNPPILVEPPCMTGAINILTDTISGTIPGDTGGTEVVFQLGEYGMYYDQIGRIQPKPPGGGAVESVVTETDGSFTYQPGFASNLGAESLFSVDFQVDGIWIRSYVYPDQPVFMVQQYNTIAGYAEVGKTINVEVYDGSSTFKWSSLTNAYGPHGFYTFNDVPIEPGDSVDVQVEGESSMTTTIDYLGDFNFDVVNNTIIGTAPDGDLVRAVMWQYGAEAYYYQEDETIAAGGDVFTIDWIMDEGHAADLRPRDEVLVILPDASGNQLQIFSGPPFVSAYISLDSNLDCVLGRLDAPNLPIFVSLDKGEGEIYTRDTGWTTDVGNKYDVCFVLRDGEENIINFDSGDVVTLDSDDPMKWSGSVEVVDFERTGDTTNDVISGTSSDGDLELTVHQWQDGSYPLHGTTTMQVPVSSGNFSASFTNFDVRDGVTLDFNHYDAVTGYGNQTNNWSYWPTLPYFELQLPYGISGMVASPGETVEAWLYDTDGTTLLGYTGDDGDDDPYRYWLGDFGGYTLEPGYRVEVSASGGWTTDMIVPDLTIDGDVNTNMLTAHGPSGLLFLEVTDYVWYLNQFVPGSTALLDSSYYGWDLQPSDFVSVTYQAADGNRARVQSQLIEVSEVEFFFNPGSDDWMWGSAKPGTMVTAERDGITLFTTYADPACGGCWNIDEPLDLYPGDIITVTAGEGLSPVVIQIPDPLTAHADSSTDEVWGQIDHLDTEMVEVHGNWEGGYQEIYTDSIGNYSVIYPDIPKGADGYVRYLTMVEWSHVRFHQYFRTPDLALNVNYGHDWIEGWYPPGYEVTLTVTESDKLTEKASITLTTAEIPWWGGGTGFSTNLEGVYWEPERPDIQAGDWVLGTVEVDSVIYSSEVRVGTITGEVDITTDSISGTIDLPWLPQDIEVPIWCDSWGAPGGADWKGDQVLPNGIDTYTCAWDPNTEWDVEAYQDIAVSYRTLENHSIQNVFKGYTDELILNIHYDHNWIDGNYEPDHTVNLTVYDSEDHLKASISMPTGYIDGWGDTTGFATYQEGVEWVPEHPDIQPGDRIHGEVDDGSQFWADVVIGDVTGETDLITDSISGTVDAEWLLPGPVDVGCYIWEENGRNVYDSVVPDGVDTYECVFEGDNYYNIVPGTNLMVSYFEPEGHQLIGEFRPPAPYLKIEKWFIGDGSPGVGGNAAFWVEYQNQGGLPAENVTITDTMVGMTYLSDGSGITPTGGDTLKTWDLGTVDPGDWIGFVLFTEVTASEGQPITNTVEISTSNPYDMGDPLEKVSTWEGTVAANDTYLSVDKWTWTWNPAPGEDYVYTINICNNGSTSSSEISVIDTLPPNTTFNGHWWGADVGWQEVGYDEGTHTLALSHTCVSPRTCSEAYIQVTLDPSASPNDDLYNHVVIAADNDLSTGDDEAEVHHNVGEPYMDLGIWQNWHWGVLVPGGYYRYGISFRNEGNIGVDVPIEIKATLPPGTSFDGWDSWGSAVVGDPVEAGSVITWTLTEGLPPGFDGTIEVWLTIDMDTLPETVLEHLAEIDIQAGESDIDNNISLLSLLVNDHGPNLRLRKEGGVWGDGHNVWYRLIVENIGDQTVNDVVVTDTYPVGMELDGEVNTNYWEGWSWSDNDPEDQALSVYLDRVEPGWNFEITFNTIIPGEDPLQPGVIYVNIAEIEPVVGDVNPDDNFASYTMATGPDMYVEKTWDSGDFSAGEQVTYVLTFGNMHHDNDWWWDMTGNAILTDELPEGMSFVSAEMHWCESTEWCEVTPDIDGQTLTWNLYPIGRSNWNEIRLTVEIGDVEQTNPLINEVMIGSDQPLVDVDPYPENNFSFYDPGLVVTFSTFLPLILR